MPNSFFALSYIIINIDPVFNIGPLAIHWYGVAYVVAILIALWAILRYARRLGLDPEIVYSVFWWAALGGLIGGRLYFVIQQPDLVTNYLEKPLNIIAVWNGGMAFFGAIFLGVATVAFVAWRRKLPIWLTLDIATFFAAVGQIFGRFGNLVNGDIVGYTAGTLSVPPDTSTCALPNSAPCLGYVSDPNVVPWATLYTNANSFTQTSVPVHPAAAYEILMNLLLLAILVPLLLRLPRIKMGLVSLVYLMGYAITQFIVFFWRGSEPTVPFLGIDALKQAQWTAIIVLILLIPYYFLIRRTSRAWTPEEAKAVNTFQAQRRLPAVAPEEEVATPEDQEQVPAPTLQPDTAQTGDDAQTEELPQEAPDETAEAAGLAKSGADNAEQAATAEPAPGIKTRDAQEPSADAAAEPAPMAEENEASAAKRSAESSAVSSATADEPSQTAPENGAAQKAQRRRARIKAISEQSARESESSAEKTNLEE
jgi:phosphatidylglycerol:prolipoprotein diacylglycerol transferase